MTIRIAWTTVILAAAIFAGTAHAAGADGVPDGPSAMRAAQRPAWHTDYRKAVARATRLDRPLLLLFTGSDWCDWCRLLKTEVFDSPEFAAWARRTVVLVEADFPKTFRQEARLRKQNRKLARRFADAVREGYPTILFLDPRGARTLGELGYMEGGPGAWIEAADRILSGSR